jgi:UDP-glucose 6-dehydrogenase
MKIAMIGTGYVGLVSGVCFAEFGFQVTCVDKNPAIIDRLQAGEVTIYEPGLDELLVSVHLRGAVMARLTCSISTRLPMKSLLR